MKKHSKVNLWATRSSTIVSITLVLFILGLLLMVEYHSYRQTHDMQERITFKVDLNPEITNAEALALQHAIEKIDYVKHVDYISREQAAEIFTEDLDDDFVGFIGYNPLYPSMMVNLRADLLPESSPHVQEQFKHDVIDMDFVTGVTYQENVVNELNDVFHKLTLLLIAFIILLVVISILMIRSTISIALYAQRDTIRTMQLVGAKMNFIARPFVGRSIWYGFLGGLFAVLALAVALFAANQSFMTFNLLGAEHLLWYSAIAVVMILMGMFICWLSTLFAVLRYHGDEN